MFLSIHFKIKILPIQNYLKKIVLMGSTGETLFMQSSYCLQDWNEACVFS